MSIIAIIKKLRLNVYILFYSFLPIKKNKIIMWADSFKHYGCSPKYLTEYLLANCHGKYDIVWVFDSDIPKQSDFPKDARAVKYFSLDYLKELHTAHFIVCNMRIGRSYMWHKRASQIYIQTWHSSIRLKRIEKDASNFLPKEYINEAIYDSSQIDLIISGCDFSTGIFKNSFWYSGQILKVGTPRCDIFFSDSKEIAKQKVYDSLKIDRNNRVVLYAPTFRNNKDANLHGINISLIKAALRKRTGNDWDFLYRFHPNIVNPIVIDEDGKDVSSYSDMQELLAAADILITDYSSCMFDMAIIGKPCLLFAPDLKTYLNSERGLYFTPDELPFPMAINNEQLVRIISEFDQKAYFSRIDEFLMRIGSYEKGNASESIAKYIETKL